MWRIDAALMGRGLTRLEWEKIIEELEELDDIRAYDEAKSGPQDTIPFEQAVREIEEG